MTKYRFNNSLMLDAVLLLAVSFISYVEIAGQASNSRPSPTPAKSAEVTRFPGNVTVAGDLSVEGKILVNGSEIVGRPRTVAITQNSVTLGNLTKCEVACNGSAKVVVAAAAPCTVTSETGSATSPEPSFGRFGLCCVCKP
jgi:hypothetical protein